MSGGEISSFELTSGTKVSVTVTGLGKATLHFEKPDGTTADIAWQDSNDGAEGTALSTSGTVSPEDEQEAMQKFLAMRHKRR